MPDASTTAPDLAADLALALRLADAADAVALARFDAPDLEVSTKADASFVTESDLATERAIRDILAAERPEDAVFGEEFGEDAGARGASPRRWIIDPIDGTAAYRRGVPLWSVLIALEIDGAPRVGVVSMPGLGRRWWAAEGLGAYTSGGIAGGGEDASGPRRIRTSDVDDLAAAEVGTQSIGQWDDAGHLDALVALTRAVGRDRAIGDAWPYMLLAEGRLEFVAEFDVKLYDIAAHAVIVREAGGVFTSYEGADDLSAGSSFATNAPLRPAFAALLREADGDTDGGAERAPE